MAFDWNSYMGGSGQDIMAGGRITSIQPTAGAGGGVMGAGGATGGDGSLAQGLTNQFNAANTANQARFDKMMKLANQFGAAQKNQSAIMARQQGSQGTQSLISRGLYNSSAAQALTQNVQQQQFNRDLQTGESVNQQKLGVLGQVQDQQPNLALYASLFAQPRAGGGGAIAPMQTQLGSSTRSA